MMKMKKIKKLIALLSIICAVTLLFTACSNAKKFKVNDDGQYVDKKNNIAYVDAPACSEPIAMGEELYGKMESAKIYEIVGADPEKWLCESMGTVFYAADVKLPDLDEMDISYIRVNADDIERTRIFDEDTVSALVSAYVYGEAMRKPSYTESMLEISWHLKFADESIGIYYVLNYIELTEDYIVTDDSGVQINYGRKFIFNRRSCKSFRYICIMCKRVR